MAHSNDDSCIHGIIVECWNLVLYDVLQLFRGLQSHGRKTGFDCISKVVSTLIRIYKIVLLTGLMKPPGSHLIGSPKDLKNAFERESFTKTCHIKKTHQDAVDFAFFAHQALRSLFPEDPETVAFQTPLITHPSKSSRPRELGNSRPSRPQLPPPVAHVSVPGSRPDSTKHNPRPLRSSRSRREVLRNRNRVRSRPSEETLVH